MRSSLRLKLKTPLEKEELHKINTILMHLINQPDSLDFREPVDWKALDLLDYPDLVKKPMDLGTIYKKLKEKQKKYKYVEQVLNDIQLIWDNCKLYNPKDSHIYALADKLQLSFRKMVKNYLPQLKIATVTSKPLKPIISEPFEVKYMPQRQDEKTSMEERKKFSEKMLYLNSDQLQDMIQKIKQVSPEAFVEKNDEDAQIEVDRIYSESFIQCRDYLENLFQKREEDPSEIQKSVAFD